MYLNDICIPESFNTKISHQLYNNRCKFTGLKHEFKKVILYSKTGLKRSLFEDLWYIKINPTKIWYGELN